MLEGAHCCSYLPILCQTHSKMPFSCVNNKRAMHKQFLRFFSWVTRLERSAMGDHENFFFVFSKFLILLQQILNSTKLFSFATLRFDIKTLCVLSVEWPD